MVLDLIAPERLEKSLRFFLEKLVDSPPTTHYDALSAEDFVQDANLNQSRDFLVAIIKDKSSSNTMVELSMKILIRMGVNRWNPEDFLIAARLVDEDPSLAKRVDLRAELSSLPALSGVSKG